MRFLALDPGEKHTGWALFEDDADDWNLVASGEWGPNEAIREIEEWVFPRDRTTGEITKPDLDYVVIEEFRLYPWKSQEQGFSEMLTCQMIGVIKYICNKAKMPFKEQGASIKKPTRAICKAKGVRRLTGTGNHAADAQLHGWYHILKDLEGEEIGVG